MHEVGHYTTEKKSPRIYYSCSLLRLGIREFERVLDTFTNHYDTIINYFDRRLTNASAESFNAKVKAFRTQFRGVGDVKFFMFRLATQFA